MFDTFSQFSSIIMVRAEGNGSQGDLMAVSRGAQRVSKELQMSFKGTTNEFKGDSQEFQGRLTGVSKKPHRSIKGDSQEYQGRPT